MKRFTAVIAAALALAAVAGPRGLEAQGGAAPVPEPDAPRTIAVTSPTMQAGTLMPRDYAPDGRNVSPPLEWENVPAGTEQIVVLCQDFGAGNPPPWVHWILYNVPGTATGVPEGIPFDASQPMPAQVAGAVQGNNGWGLAMYRGPAPPVGDLHEYHFVVYALDEALNLPAGLTRAQLLQAIDGHVIAQGEMVSTYERVQMPDPTATW
jgi:Raf kinase inhibitor-like YbhB/YbcL family protein